jgi:hypothetical protein
MLQVGPARDRCSCGILGGRGSPNEPVDRARAMENAKCCVSHSSLDGAENAPPTTAHKALLGFTDEEQLRKMTRLAKGELTAVVASLR